MNTVSNPSLNHRNCHIHNSNSSLKKVSTDLENSIYCPVNKNTKPWNNFQSPSTAGFNKARIYGSGKLKTTDNYLRNSNYRRRFLVQGNRNKNQSPTYLNKRVDPYRVHNNPYSRGYFSPNHVRDYPASPHYSNLYQNRALNSPSSYPNINRNVQKV